MPVKTKTYLKQKFESGDKPTQEDFHDLIDSSYNTDAMFPDINETNTGKYLRSNGVSADWDVIQFPEELPTQIGNEGKFLTTDGTSASWSNVDALPNQASASGLFLTSNGTSAFWDTIPETFQLTQTINNQPVSSNPVLTSDDVSALPIDNPIATGTLSAPTISAETYLGLPPSTVYSDEMAVSATSGSYLPINNPVAIGTLSAPTISAETYLGLVIPQTYTDEMAVSATSGSYLPINNPVATGTLKSNSISATSVSANTYYGLPPSTIYTDAMAVSATSGSYLPINNPVATGTLKSPTISATTYQNLPAATASPAFKAVIAAGNFDLVGKATEPTLVGIQGTNRCWTELQYTDMATVGGNLAYFEIPARLTNDYKGGALNCQINFYYSETATASFKFIVALESLVDASTVDVVVDANVSTTYTYTPPNASSNTLRTITINFAAPSGLTVGQTWVGYLRRDSINDTSTNIAKVLSLVIYE